MSKMKVVRVDRMEFETEDGHVFPIDPPLLEDITPDEFQKHYDLAAALVGSLQATRHNPTDTATMGQSGEDKDSA